MYSIILALERQITLNVEVPLVVRLEGTNVDNAKQIIADSGLKVTISNSVYGFFLYRFCTEMYGFYFHNIADHPVFALILNYLSTLCTYGKIY